MNSIARKLTLLIVATLVATLSIGALINLKLQERAAMRVLRLNGAEIADLVVAATRRGMLANDRAGIQETIETLARQPNIERIRIIRKGGQIAYSTEPREIGATVDTEAEQCASCHRRRDLPETLPTVERSRIVRRGAHRVLGITQTIANAPECTGACHAHSASEPLLGVLDVNLLLDPYDRARERSAAEMTLANLLGILLVVVVTALSVHRFVKRPVDRLIQGTSRIAAGDLSARVTVDSSDELGTLARQFNKMAHDLEAARAELLEWGATLERRVEHKTLELKQAQERILQIEKMASLGKLAAVVAHEINNPLASVVTYARTLVRRLHSQHEMTDECRENLTYLEAIASEAARCGQIVAELLSFARQRSGEFRPVDVNQVVDKALFLVHHKCEMSGVDCRKNLAPDLPQIAADPDQLLQALMALLINALQALEDGGTISVSTRRGPDALEIVVEDDGPGMAPEVAERAFEPFFTTRDDDGGVGLGLSVVLSIVEHHGGDVRLDTAPGRGCRFTLTLPIRRADQAPQEER